MLMALRYLLILCPAIGTILSISLQSSGLLTFQTLLLLALAELRRNWLAGAARTPAAVLEIVFVGWLGSEYGSLMYLCHLSTMASYLSTPQLRSRRMLFFLQLIWLLYTLPYRELPMFTAGCILGFAAFAALLHTHASSKARQSDLEKLVNELRTRSYEQAASEQRVHDYAREVEHLAQVEERNRISREIHDDLGHRLIRLKMMLEAAVHVAPAEPEKSLALTKQVLAQLSEGMEKLRSTVRKLKPDENEVQSYSLRSLIEGLAAESQLEVDYEWEGNPMLLYPSLEFVLYRNAQEAITNALRHGSATKVHIKLCYEPAAVRLTVSNNGRTPELPSLRKGLGLTGMEERTRLLGGELLLSAGPVFAVTTLLPIRN